MFKKSFVGSCLLSSSLLLLLLAGCSSNEGGGRADGKDVKQAESMKKDPDPITLHFWHHAIWSEERFMETFGNAIKKKFPHITPKFYVHSNGSGTSMRELVASGSPVDVYWGGLSAILSNIKETEMNTNMEPLIKKHNVDLTAFEPSSIQGIRDLSDGNVTALPFSAVTLTVFYNKDIFDKFGVSYPKDGMDWDQFYDLAQKLTRREGGIDYQGYTSTATHVLLFNNLSQNMIDRKTNKSTFNDDNWRLILNNLLRFYRINGNEVKAANIGAFLNPQNDAFYKNQTAAMMNTVTSVYSLIPDTMKWDAVSAPYYKQFPDVGPQISFDYMGVSSITKYPDQAMEVVKFLTSEQFQIENSRKGITSSLRSNKVWDEFGKDNPKLQGKNTNAFRAKNPAPSIIHGPYQSIAEGQMWSTWAQVVSGDKDVPTALREAAEKVNQQIEQQKH
jgi:multiple sugar transport system substrate-binding protein